MDSFISSFIIGGDKLFFYTILIIINIYMFIYKQHI